ncbi:MAG: Mur ligase domain-containing protein, partial [Clostridia bacterium]|nr:Mur ligase domain-containing protein [Clostridia bacterium]
IDDCGSFYFIGIGGISMGALAKYMLALRKKVGGSDEKDTPALTELKSLGALIDDGSADISRYDTIVYTDAIKPNDSQLKQARSLNKKVIPRGKFLREICKNFNNVTAICGCHGKTTCTAMLSNIYFTANKKFMAHIGGRDINLSNFYYSGNDSIITEACEYKRNFLSLKPDIAVVLNTGCDHIECYRDYEDLKQSYVKFASRAKKVVSLYGGVCAEGAVTFGFSREADFYAEKIKCGSGGTSFELYSYGEKRGRIDINAYGRHNVLNALAAAAAADAAGIALEDIRQGLRHFNGVERRMEKIGLYCGANCIADYAHHPEEIKATVKTVKKLTQGEVFVVFQPHTYSRTKNLFPQFVSVLSDIRHLLIYKTFAAREYYDDAGSALTLCNSVKRAKYGESPIDIENFINKAKKSDIILFLGAGDIYFIAKSIVNR